LKLKLVYRKIRCPTGTLNISTSHSKDKGIDKVPNENPWNTSACNPATLHQHKLSAPTDVKNHIRQIRQFVGDITSSEKPADPTDRRRVLFDGHSSNTEGEVY